MYKNFMPDGIFGTFDEISPDLLEKMKVKALLLDIDNTLVTYDDEYPTEKVEKWLKSVTERGIKAAFVSNNSSPERVRKFNERLNFCAVSKSKKPLKYGFLKAVREMGVEPKDCLSIGDQIFTDVWGAKRIGARAFLVSPIKDKTTPFFKMKRFLEKPIIREYKKRKNEKEK